METIRLFVDKNDYEIHDKVWALAIGLNFSQILN